MPIPNQTSGFNQQQALTTPEDVLANRYNRTYCVRYDDLINNILVLDGGQPYINARLTRFPGESTIDWAGSNYASSAEKNKWGQTQVRSEGRKGRAYLVNHARRVADKICQYVFAVPPKREGVPPELAIDITRQGQSLNRFMCEVLRHLVATKWCWIGVDAPNTVGVISKARAAGEDIRPYFVLYSAADVVDWHINEKGVLTWLLTETIKWDNPDPTKLEESTVVRRLWEPGKVTEFEVDRSSNQQSAMVGTPVVTEIDFDGVPFVPCGEITDKPHFYDDVESVQRAILDLESSIDTLMHKVVFAQPVLPKSMADDIAGETNGADLAQKVAAITGYNYAILESKDDKGVSRYIAPDSVAIGKMQDELGRKREILFDTIGLHLGFGKNFSEAVEAKQFDFLDPQAVLRNYAQQITEAETKAWKLMHEFDSSIPVIVPEYATKFRVSDIYEDFKSLVLAGNMDLPISVKKLIARGVVDAVQEITNLTPTSEAMAEIDKDIDDMEEQEPILLSGAEMAGKVNAGVTKQATDDGEGVRVSGAQ